MPRLHKSRRSSESSAPPGLPPDRYSGSTSWAPRPLVRNLFAYTIAIAIVVFIARQTSIAALLSNLRQANLWLFIPVCTFAFLLWFLNETLLFSKLFTYFHCRTSFREVLIPNAAQYFLQIVNAVVAGSAMVFFIHRRKGVAWMAGSCTMLFQAFIDFQLLALMALVSTALVPGFPIRLSWYYPTAVLCATSLITYFWMRGRPRWRIAKWCYDRPSMRSFREARLYHYAVLTLIRAPIFIIQGFVLYLELLSFHIHVPLKEVLAATPIVIILTSLPITPVGLGSEQAVIALGFAAFASRSSLLAMSLAVSAAGILFRIALGLGSVGSFARETAGFAAPVEMLRENSFAQSS